MLVLEAVTEFGKIAAAAKDLSSWDEQEISRARGAILSDGVQAAEILDARTALVEEAI